MLRFLDVVDILTVALPGRVHEKNNCDMRSTPKSTLTKKKSTNTNAQPQRLAALMSTWDQHQSHNVQLLLCL